MKRTNRKLNAVTVPTVAEQERRARRANTDKQWEQNEENSHITRKELRQRVSALREELESYQRQIEALPFDIPSGDVPYCLDWSERKYHVTLIESFNPTLDSLFEMIDKYAEQHGCHEDIDFNSKLFQLKSEYAATGFRIGVLAGVMLAGCPKDLIDRFERGLEFAFSTPGARMLKDNGL